MYSRAGVGNPSIMSLPCRPLNCFLHTCRVAQRSNNLVCCAADQQKEREPGQGQHLLEPIPCNSLLQQLKANFSSTFPSRLLSAAAGGIYRGSVLVNAGLSAPLVQVSLSSAAWDHPCASQVLCGIVSG